MAVDWDATEWGNRIHVATWAPDLKHGDETDEENH